MHLYNFVVIAISSSYLNQCTGIEFACIFPFQTKKDPFKWYIRIDFCTFKDENLIEI